MYKLGKRSLEELATCHKDLRLIAKLAIQMSPVDFGIHQGGRTIELQQQYFNQNKSRINPQTYKSPEALAEKAKHIVIEDHKHFSVSRAFDFHIASSYEKKRLTWDDLHLGIVIGCFFAAAHQLKKEKKITHEIRSGGNWDMDGVFVYDHKLKDLPHIELI